MVDMIHVYVDEKAVIHEIELTEKKDLDQYQHVAIPLVLADEVHDLYIKRKEDATIYGDRKFVLLEIEGTYYVKKTMYIYYNLDDKSIYGITPRLQQELSDNENLGCGLSIINDIIEDCINGVKSMINCFVNTDDLLLILEEKPIITAGFDFFKTINLITNFEVKEINDAAIIDIIYNGVNLIITRTDDSAVGEHYKLQFINKFDKTRFYGSTSFKFDEKCDEIILLATLTDDYMVISEHNNIMSFGEN